MIALAAAALALAQQGPVVLQAPPPADFSLTTDAEFCSIMRQVATSMASDLPLMEDEITRLDDETVNCRRRIFATSHSISVNLSAMAAGWRAREQEQWNRLICDDQGFRAMARRGWRFRDNITFRSGERVAVNARC